MKIGFIGRLSVAILGMLVVANSYLAYAEQRTWTAASGVSTTIAEFIELKDNKVSLRKQDGTVVHVPLELLSEADRNHVKQLTAGRPAPLSSPVTKQATLSEEDATRALKALSKEADLCRSAEEAAMLFSVFLADESVPISIRSQARAQQAEWESKAQKGLVRLGKNWVTVDEIRNARTQAAFLVNQGVEMVRLNQNQLGLEKLVEASKTDPDGIHADFVIATIYALSAKNYEKACQHYDNCLRRDPNNVAVLNNLALCELRRAEFADAMAHWKRAANLRYDQRIAQNIGRVLDVSGQKRFNIPQTAIKQLGDIYASMVVANKVFGTDKGRGWNYILIPMPDPNDVNDPAVTAAVKSTSADELTYLGAGTGFVIADKYVLTNRTTTKGGSLFLISNPNEKGQMLTANLVASSKDMDLALLKCDELAAAPMPIDIDVIYRIGSEVSVLSYSLSDMLGVDVKANHGRLVMPPSAAVRFMVQYNATVAGSGGGPVVDSMGNAIAVHCRAFEARELHYACGIPMIRAMKFVRESVPEIELKPRNKADIPWTQIDNVTAKSTVLVVTKGKAQDVGLAAAGEQYLEDNSCVRCNGLKSVRCPVRSCTNGRVPSVQTTNSKDPISGRSVQESVTVRVQCSNCRGDGKVTCPDCHGSGIDPTFNRGSRGGSLPTGVKVRSTLSQ